MRKPVRNKLFAVITLVALTAALFVGGPSFQDCAGVKPSRSAIVKA